MKKLIGFLGVAACVGTIQTASAGDITGKVTLKGTPPPAPEMPLKADPFCGKIPEIAGAASNPRMPFYAVDKSGGLADVFIYIKEGAKPAPPPAQPVVIDQVQCQYTPYVVGLQAKQKILVKNSDPLMHNVHPQPTVAGNKEYNKAQPANAAPLEFVFDNPEIFLRFRCDVHPWMFSYVGIVDHPYFAVSGKDGTFKIANVPPGEYTIEAVHRKTHLAGGKGLTQKIKVGADGAKADFTVEVPAQ
ncbi:MAG: hypothetical protein FJ398_02710 [Verrucomicrobia bacterium]|nr:hypothetical protein [Verrucomicrobiota bacterium]